MNEDRVAFNRRRFFECLSALGLGSTLLPDALTIAAQDSETVTVEMIEAAQKIARVSFTREEQQAIVTRLNACDNVLDALARRGQGTPLTPADEWGDQPGAIPELT